MNLDDRKRKNINFLYINKKFSTKRVPTTALYVFWKNSPPKKRAGVISAFKLNAEMEQHDDHDGLIYFI